MMDPYRIQRLRKRGSKMPPGTIFVGRPTRWGNPFHRHSWQLVEIPGVANEVEQAQLQNIGRAELMRVCVDVGSVHHCLAWYRVYAESMLRMYPEWVKELRGKNLACWCPLDEPCHADVLLEIANR